MAVWNGGRPAWWAKMPVRPGLEARRVLCSWCNSRRGILPSGVLICPRCEFTGAGGPPGPAEGEIKDAPLDWS